MLTPRRLLVAGIVVLAAAQCLVWLLAGTLGWLLRDFMVGNDPLVLAQRTRDALAAIGWAGINILGLVAYASRRRGWGRWSLAGIQLTNLVVTLWLGYGQISQTCGQNGLEWFVLTGLAAVTLLLQYILWRRLDRSTQVDPTSSPVRPSVARLRSILPGGERMGSLTVIVVLMVVGVGLIGLAWSFSLQGVQQHSGIARATRVEPGTISTLVVTLDSSSHQYYFDDVFYEQLPDVRVGDRVVILTSESCGYGAAIAIQSDRGLWVDSISDFGIRPFTPETWPIHEAIRWLVLALGIAVSSFGVANLLRRIG